MKKLSLVIIIVFMLNLLSSCSPVNSSKTNQDVIANNDLNNSTNEKNEKKVLNVSTPEEPTTLDNQGGVDVSNGKHLGTIFEGLITIVNDRATPGVAKSWDVSEDGLRYTFHLREDAAWADGQPVTAYDFEYSFKRLVDPNGPNGNYAWQGDYIKNGKQVRKGELPVDELKVKALDDHNFQIEITSRMPYFIEILQNSSFYPTRKDYVEKYKSEYASSPDKIIGNGPFILKEWKHEEELIYVKNPKYWNSKEVQMEQINAYIISDEQTTVNMFERGELDYLARVPNELKQKYIENGMGNVLESATGWWLVCNVSGNREEDKNKYLKNKNFRQAISSVMDRTEMAVAIAGYASKPLNRINSNILALNDSTWGEKYPTDVIKNTAELEKAKKLFDDALKELNVKVEDIPVFTLLVDDRPVSKTGGEIIQSVVKSAFNINIEINTQTYKSRVDMEHKGDYDFCLSSWAPDYNDAMSNVELFESNNSYNLYFGGYKNSEYDKFIEKANTTSDMDERAECMKKCEDLLLEDLPVIPIYNSTVIWAMQKGISNILKCPLGVIDPIWSFAKYSIQ